MTITALGALLACALALFVASRYVERQRITRNVRHDAEWLFRSLANGNELAAAATLRTTEARADSQRLGQLLVKHAATLSRADFASLDLSVIQTEGLLLATFDCGGGVRAVFSSPDGGELWYLADITGP